MVSFGYSFGDGTGTNLNLYQFHNRVILSRYENDTGDWVWITHVEIINANDAFVDNFQVAIYSDAPAPLFQPWVNLGESNILPGIDITPNTFSFADKIPVAPGDAVWVALTNNTLNDLRFNGCFAVDREAYPASTSFPDDRVNYFYASRILPAIVYGDNTTDPTGTELRVSNVVAESVIEGYSTLRANNLVAEPLVEGYSTLRASNIVLEVLYAIPSYLLIPQETFMSTEVFPELIGLSFNVVKKPTFNTRVARSINGNEVRNSLMQFPLWEFELTYDYLPDKTLGTTDLKTIMGFFLSRKGRFDSFLFKDPDDYVTTASAVGTGDGVTTAFYFTRSLGGFVEPIGQIDISEDYSVYVDGVEQTEGADYDITLPNLMIFNSAPADGALITNSLQYYFRCRFQEDEQEYEKFMDKLWELQTCSFVSLAP